MRLIKGKIKKDYHNKIVLFYLKEKLQDKFDNFLWALTTGRILSDGVICEVLNTKLSTLIHDAYFVRNSNFDFVINKSLAEKANKIYQLLLKEKYLNQGS